MKKHLPWIGALLGVGVLLAGLHFLIFAPLKTQYDEVQGQLGRSVASLKDEINSIRWKEGKTPDPKRPDFSWKRLLEEARYQMPFRFTSL